MKIGVPKEIKLAERRVAATPAGVKALTDHEHQVYVEAGAGVGSGFLDEAYLQAGAKLLERAEDIWGEADMILKVKEPIGPEFEWMRPGQILFTYLHLAADRELTDKLLAKQVVGMAGLAAAMVADGIGARVYILDVNSSRLRYIREVMSGRVVTLNSNPVSIEEECLVSNLVIGTVLIPGAKAPKLISRDLVKRMQAGSAIVDVSVDQGGCVETTRPTTHEEPTYVEEGVVHYCVTNMPGAVPRTSTIALTNETFTYVLAIAEKGWQKAMADNPALRRGLNVCNGQVICAPVAESFGLPCTDLDL
jgi:alanine dehydrogenase